MGQGALEGVKVGDTLYYLPRDSSLRKPLSEQITPMQVTKVGRTWVTALRYGQQVRFDLMTGLRDGCGYSSPGQAYRGLDEVNAIHDRRKLTYEVRRLLQDFDLARASNERLLAMKALLTKEEHDSSL